MRELLVAGLAVREWGDPAAPGILLWPGLGSTSGYFGEVAEAMPGRAVAVDPPGFGASPPLAEPTFERMVAAAAAVVRTCGCRAMVGHSLGAYVAVGVANDPPPELRAVVLIDGGYLGAAEMAELGFPPVGAGRAEFVAWAERNDLRFPDWETAFSQIAAMIGARRTPALEAILGENLVEIEGEVRDRATPERIADAVLAIHAHDVPALASTLGVPALLIACPRMPAGMPDRRALRERAWRAFAGASPLVELHVEEGWGHNPILQDPEASAALIADWLRPRV